THVHQNIPGVLRDVNRIVSEVGANVVAQVLGTDAGIGYLIFDFEGDSSAPPIISERLARLETTIRVRRLP
ncbi:MAG: phosphoglycerate dehydrogenase, partial [Deltaproteobacteria bacterium]|nr:phosphoglycerate dehydrogenase [Deltaproteobacteria bacterium]